MISPPNSKEDPMRWPTLPWLLWALASSLVLHGVAYASLGLAPKPEPAPNISSELAFEVNAPPPAPPPPEPEPPEPPASEPTPVANRPAPAVKREALSPPKSEPASPSAAAPVDLSGVTLTNAGSDFAMQGGNGLALGTPGPRVAARLAPTPTTAQTSLGAPGAELVPLSDLSSRPVPPALEAALRQHYPEEARRRGVSGTARVRARLDPDGVARRIQVEQESFASFGEACRRTLLGSRWSAPRDRSGRPVATEIHYTCRFRVEP
jgi:protein TonB